MTENVVVNIFVIIGILFYFFGWIQLTIASYLAKRIEKMKNDFLKVDKRVKKNLQNIFEERKQLELMKIKKDEYIKENNK